MEPKNEGLEDDYPFQTGDVQVSTLIFQGVQLTALNEQLLQSGIQPGAV